MAVEVDGEGLAWLQFVAGNQANIIKIGLLRVAGEGVSIGGNLYDGFFVWVVDDRIATNVEVVAWANVLGDGEGILLMYVGAKREVVDLIESELRFLLGEGGGDEQNKQ